MPKNDRERTRKARALMQWRPELNYTRALAEVDAAHAPLERDVDLGEKLAVGATTLSRQAS